MAPNMPFAQYCYDNDFFFSYLEQCRAAGVTIPIIPGIMPIYTLKLTQMLSKVCGTTIPAELQRGLDQLDAEDKKAVLDFGVDFAVRTVPGPVEKGRCRIAFLHHGSQPFNVGDSHAAA